MKLVLLFILVIFSSSAEAAIKNVLPLPGERLPDGFRGGLNLSFDEKSGNTERLGGKIGSDLSYSDSNSLLLFTGQWSYHEAKAEVVENNSFSHLRYRHYFGDSFSIETLVQLETDQFKNLEWRFLSGMGLRFETMLGEVSGFDFGAILLFENERFSSKLELDDERNLRASFYSGFIYKLKLNSEFSFRAYYQPLLDFFEDYRYSLNSSLKSSITENFSVSYTVSMSHDNKPLPDIKEFDRVSSVSFSLVF